MGTIWTYYLYVYMRLNYSPAAVWTIALIISIVWFRKGGFLVELLEPAIGAVL
ncbi:uncharacterized protein BO87DRAFT_377488 [Aspergillus neoniger CBS 115656]|uniref:Uncharacterized protein n=1 Tax=Aspergillus neoniger (strain CBS 115656) TaxID=1448310 RepID=A0A318YGK8_ASPNB|nr:hypothetical protein BO87DRAFT_377488 [Aspergillus neoniger CBS 115656]PYH33329.1 hypothetical protein BO87DRAFT_377488 [Aspergillus neoniger CBS 115656]